MSAADLIQELRDGLEGVTPGPWKQFRRNGVNEVQHGRSNVPVVAWSGFDDSSRPEHEHAANAAHIARCHPENIRTLLDALASKDTALAEIRAELAEFDEANRMLVKSADGWRDKYRAAEAELERWQANWDANVQEMSEKFRAVNLAQVMAGTNMDLLERAQSAESELARLRAALIACGRNVGAWLADTVSTDFLMLVPEEVRLVVDRLRAASRSISQDGEERS